MAWLVAIIADDVVHILTKWSAIISPLFTVISCFIAVGIRNLIQRGVYVKVEGIDLVL